MSTFFFFIHSLATAKFDGLGPPIVYVNEAKEFLLFRYKKRESNGAPIFFFCYRQTQHQPSRLGKWFLFVSVCARMTGTTTRVACSIFQKKKREANKWKAVTNIFFFNNKKNKQNKQNRINNIQGGTIDRRRPYWIVKLVFYFQLTHVHLQMKRLLNSTRRRSFDLTKDALTRRWMCPCF